MFAAGGLTTGALSFRRPAEPPRRVTGMQSRILWSAKRAEPTLPLRSSVITKSRPCARLSAAKEPLMKSILLFLALIAIAACGDTHDAARPVHAQPTVS